MAVGSADKKYTIRVEDAIKHENVLQKNELWKVHQTFCKNAFLPRCYVLL